MSAVVHIHIPLLSAAQLRHLLGIRRLPQMCVVGTPIASPFAS